MDLRNFQNGNDEWSYGVPCDVPNDFTEVIFELSVSEFKSYMHAAHGAIYSKSDDILWNKYRTHALVLMQMRSDGNIGFGGGLAGSCQAEEIIGSLNREFKEEFNMDLQKHAFTQSDHVITYVNHRKKLVAHMFALEVTKDQFLSIEKNAFGARDWGTETFGTVRVPLFVVEYDNCRGFPVFLANQFAGCAKEQLITTLKKRELIPKDQLQFALKCHDSYLTALKTVVK